MQIVRVGGFRAGLLNEGLADMLMLVMAGGKERDPSQFRELLSRAGLRLVKIHRTRCPLGIVEAVVAPESAQSPAAKVSLYSCCKHVAC